VSWSKRFAHVSSETREELRVVNPIIEPNYERLFQVIVDVDSEVLMLRGRKR
jgi:hypothetical protein